MKKEAPLPGLKKLHSISDTPGGNRTQSKLELKSAGTVIMILTTYTCHACAYACWKQNPILYRWGYSERAAGALRDCPPRFPPQALDRLPLERLAPSLLKFQQALYP